MGKLFKNTYLDALAKTVLVYACIHATSMLMYTIQSGNFYILNGFSILGINLFYPFLGKGNEFFALSLLFLGCIYVLVFSALKKKKKL